MDAIPIAFGVLWLAGIPVTGVALRLLADGPPGARGRRDRCRACGYSLAGLSEDAACPECGRCGATDEPIEQARAGWPWTLVVGSVVCLICGALTSLATWLTIGLPDGWSVFDVSATAMLFTPFVVVVRALGDSIPGWTRREALPVLVMANASTLAGFVGLTVFSYIADPDPFVIFALFGAPIIGVPFMGYGVVAAYAHARTTQHERQ